MMAFETFDFYAVFPKLYESWTANNAVLSNSKKKVAP